MATTSSSALPAAPAEDDYRWMEVLMERAGRFMDAITLHYYTVPGTWQHKGSATEFDQAEYEQTRASACAWTRSSPAMSRS